MIFRRRYQSWGKNNGKDHATWVRPSNECSCRSAGLRDRRGESATAGRAAGTAGHREPASREGHRLRQGRRHGPHARRLSSARGRHREAHGHHPSLRRRLLRRQQERRLHHQRRQGARRPRLHERLGELSAADARLVAGADSRRQSRDPLDARERRRASASTPTRSSSPATRPAACCR